MRRNFLYITFGFCFLGRILGAEVEGRVDVPGRSTTPVVNLRYQIVSKDGVLSTNPSLGVVYLEGSFPEAPVTPVAEIRQEKLGFVPALLPVRVGTKVIFPNVDPYYHNVFSFSATKRFDLGRYKPEDQPQPHIIFDKPGFVALRCDIHEHMRAVVLILDTPHFVTTDSSGSFRLSGLPEGRYTLKVWLDTKTTLSKVVDLREAVVARVNFP